LAVPRPGKGVCGRAKIFGSGLLQPARSVCVSERFFILLKCYLDADFERNILILYQHVHPVAADLTFSSALIILLRNQ